MNKSTLIKVPAVTFSFWLIKILATTLGETGGDTLSMSFGLGYLLSTAILFAIFLGVVIWQIRAQAFSATRYWITIIATTTAGTTLADFADRSLGIGYFGGSLLLCGLLIASLATWYATTGSIAINRITTPRTELFYWVTIMFSQTLGTALGDWVADTQGLGFGYSIIIFGSLLAITTLLYYSTQISRTALFWLAFVLTRPLGAVLGDFLDKPLADGGLEWSRLTITLTLLTIIGLSLLSFRQRPAEQPH
ncbi:MAG TPA: hypothetical protein PLH12_00745 [Pseudomonadales bacterium]|jgi:uncharacterized membrane-anchored protein|nr:hypothetical protein [Pseudomonadales bacterium]HNN86401.1 hypothetical protein [Pseudomonadales bacterium]